MQIIPKLTRQRLGELPVGTPIRIGNQTVIFNGCSIEPDFRGNDDTFIHFTDEQGQRQRFSEWVVLQSGTEYIDSEPCDYCGRFRHPDDTAVKLIRFWNRNENRTFCADSRCAERYQQSIRVPASRQGITRSRIS